MSVRESGGQESQVVMEMIRQLVTSPRIVEPLSVGDSEKNETEAVLGELLALAEEGLNEGEPLPVIVEFVLSNLTEMLLAFELRREVAARNWTISKAYRVEGQSGICLEIEELGEGSISTSGAILDVVYLDREFGQPPDRGQLDYSMLAPHLLVAMVKRVLTHKLLFWEATRDITSWTESDATPEAIEAEMKRRGFDVAVHCDAADDAATVA